MGKKPNEINQVKKHLGISKRNLILLQTFRKYRVEFEEEKDAIKFVMEKIKHEEV